MESPAYLTHTQPTEFAVVTTVPSDKHPALVYLGSLSSGSRRTMRQALDVVAEILSSGHCDHRTLPWEMVRFQHVQAVRSVLMERYSVATANKMLSALRQTLRMAWRLGYLSADEYQRAADVRSISGSEPEAAAGRALSYGEWMALFSVCEADDSAAGVRDAAIIALFKVGGLRRSEVVALQLEDYNRTTATFIIRGKRNKTRTLPIEDGGAKDALADWLYVRGDAPGPLFTRIWKGGTVTEKGLTDQGIYHILNKRGRQAGAAQFTPHDLRRSFAGELLDAGADLATVQRADGPF